MEYEIGDYVVVVKPEDADCYDVGWNDKMDLLIGSEGEVVSKYDTKYGCIVYNLDSVGEPKTIQTRVNDWTWIAEFLEPADDLDFDSKFDLATFESVLRGEP